MTTAVDKSIQTLVTDVIEGKLLLPEMQRPFVWKDYQVRNLFDSLYRNYPSGSLLVWETDALPAVHPLSVDGAEQGAKALLLLDGQQRLTSLSAILSGRPLLVSNCVRPITVLFNLETETFDTEEILGDTSSWHGKKMWISLTDYFKADKFTVLSLLGYEKMSDPATKSAADKLDRLSNIKNYMYRVNILDHMEYDEVTRIFIRVNSGGMRLSSADLALAQISSRWPGVAEKVADFNARLKQRGLALRDPGVAMRSLSALVRHRTRLDSFFRRSGNNLPTVTQLDAAWANALPALDNALNFVSRNCYVNRLDLMPSPYILIPLIAFFDRNKGANISSNHMKQLEQWFYRATVWSRYSNSTETKLDQDMSAIYNSTTINDQLSRLLEVIDTMTGTRVVTERDIRNRNNSPFYLIKRILALRNHATDWVSGIALGLETEVKSRPLFAVKDIHGPYKKYRSQDIANQFLTTSTIDATQTPAQVLGSLSEAQLRAQQIPLDPTLWQPEKFDEFLAARRHILSELTNLLMYGELPQVATDVLYHRLMALETQLREFIATQLRSGEGERAWEKLVPHDIQKRTQNLIAKKIAENPGTNAEFVDLDAKLRQCMFSQLGTIMQSNWSLFSMIFGKWDVFEKEFQAILKARNCCAHGAVTDLSDADRLHAQGALEWFDDRLSLQENQEMEEAS